MKKRSPRILLVDDHKLFRGAMVTLIRSLKISDTIFEAGSGEEAIDLLKQVRIDLILLDIQMPKMSGLDLLKIILSKQKDYRVIMLTQFDEKDLIVYALQLGADGFLLKTSDPIEFKLAISDVMTKGHYFNELTINALGKTLVRIPTHGKFQLSPKEMQILLLLKDGKSNKEVSKMMSLSVRSIESYRKKLIKKTGTRNTVDLISTAYKSGILSGTSD